MALVIVAVLTVLTVFVQRRRRRGGVIGLSGQGRRGGPGRSDSR
ncbi:MAG: hypothetical protein ACRDR6_15520 [Pseudonocardiaceae bacterium]